MRDVDVVADLASLADLHERGALTDVEFTDAKRQALLYRSSSRQPLGVLVKCATVGALTIVGTGVVVGAGLVGGLAGPLPGIAAALVADVVVLALLTLRAYPPGVKPPMLRLGLGAIVFVPVPLLYLNWRWMSRRGEATR